MQLLSNFKHKSVLDKGTTPTDRDIANAIGEKHGLWSSLLEFIEDNYNFDKELAFFSKNYGWTVRYRRNKKTLVSCFPENGAFSVLLVLGKAEAGKINLIRKDLNENFLSVFDRTEQLHDGKWLWIRIQNKGDLDSLVKAIAIKKKPKLGG